MNWGTDDNYDKPANNHLALLYDNLRVLEYCFCKNKRPLIALLWPQIAYN